MIYFVPLTQFYKRAMKHSFTHYLAFAALCAPLALGAQEANDSVKSTMLQEVVVVGENAWIEGDKAVFIPTKSEKNLSTDPASLVQSMHIPTVYVEQGTIKSLSGNSVSIFINGRPAEGIDISTFWPKQALRVEYIENSPDPQWLGAKHVINFVMVEYEYGGVTKLSGRQNIPNAGNYEVASKLEYKKMLYGLTASGGYSRDHSYNSSGSSIYKDIYYNGDFYNSISDEYSSSSWSRRDNASVAFSARYAGKIAHINHTAGLLWNRDPGSGSNTSNLWTPSLFDSNKSTSATTSHMISPQLSGDYGIQITPNKIGMRISWKYGYSHNDNSSVSQTANLTPILNSNSEDVHDGSLSIYYAHSVSSRFSFSATAQSAMQWFDTRYAGSVNQKYRMHRGNSSIETQLYYMPCDKITMSFTPGMRIDYNSVQDSDTETTVSPKASLNLYWSINKKMNLSASLAYFNISPQSNMLTDLLVRSGELSWVRGSQWLKNRETWWPDIHFTWLPSRIFRVSLSLAYHRDNNEIITINTAAPSDMGGIIRTYANGEPQDTYWGDLFFNMSLLDNKLNINLQPTWRYFKCRGIYGDNQSWFRMRGTADYTYRNCRFAIFYGGEEKGLDNAGMYRYWHSDDWNFSFTYGTGDIYLDVTVRDIFHTHRKSTSESRTPVYDELYRGFNTGRSLSLRLTYTFGYGKKVDRNINVTNPHALDSSVIK